jgi:hypothetical protein
MARTLTASAGTNSLGAGDIIALALAGSRLETPHQVDTSVLTKECPEEDEIDEECLQTHDNSLSSMGEDFRENLGMLYERRVAEAMHILKAANDDRNNIV